MGLLYMNLPLIKEPLDIKQKIKNAKSIVCSGYIEESKCDNIAVWSFNDLPKYIWDNWKGELKKHGYTWQKFTSVLKLATGDMVLWAIKESIPWEELLNRIAKLLEAYAGSRHG